MTSQSFQLPEQFEQANTRFIATIQSMSADRWRAICPGEGWSVGVVAHHIAVSHEPQAEFVRLAAAGEPLPPLRVELLDQLNAAQAVEFARIRPEDTIAVLRANGAAALEVLRGLDDRQLEQVARLPLGAELTVRQIIEQGLIGHLTGHAESIGSAE